jgi:hypothetical protein
VQFRLAETGLFRLLTHGTQIVGSGNNGKEQNQQTAKNYRKLHRLAVAPLSQPQSKGWPHQQKPAHV